jgi:uncharacterized OB-fold protein
VERNAIGKEWSFDFDFEVPLGRTYTAFMEGLKNKRFVGNVCGGRIFYPPRPFCDRTLETPGQWLECDGTGTVEAFTVVYRKANAVSYPGHERLPAVPYAVGVIRVDRSEQCLIHFLSGFGTDDPDELHEKIRAGMKVRPVWAKDRTGNILDIEYFEPAL